MANPTKCSSCWKPIFQVRISGIDLRGKTSQQVYESALNNNIVNLKHVAKRTQQDSAFLHFRNHLTASVFYNSKIRSSFVLDGVTVVVQPIILANGAIVHYNQRALHFASSSDLPSELPAERQPSVERQPEPQPSFGHEPSVEHEFETPEPETQIPDRQIPDLKLLSLNHLLSLNIYLWPNF